MLQKNLQQDHSRHLLCVVHFTGQLWHAGWHSSPANLFTTRSGSSALLLSSLVDWTGLLRTLCSAGKTFGGSCAISVYLIKLLTPFTSFSLALSPSSCCSAVNEPPLATELVFSRFMLPLVWLFSCSPVPPALVAFSSRHVVVCPARLPLTCLKPAIEMSSISSTTIHSRTVHSSSTALAPV